MKATLDRIEGEMAVLLVRGDERLRLDVPLALLPEGSREGDILDIAINRDERAKEEAKERVSSLLERLKSKSQGDAGFIEDAKSDHL
ncbi:MAG: hypothetical protein A4E48_02641 [Methanosaeta sp. PtaU1.Bin060]|jgi:hypothetical protein|nr:MAG: hypothetical protein A4E48_02641 [Methanosaeta sp. PtaU1.Bin060]